MRGPESSHRGVSTIVTVLAGVIATLGTSIFFLSSESLNSFFGDLGIFGGEEEVADQDLAQKPTDSNPASIAEQSSPLPGSESDDGSESNVELAHSNNSECNATPIHAGEEPPLGECFDIFNVHTWVNKVGVKINERSTTAFIVQNTGIVPVTINSIILKDVAVPTTDWFFTTDPTVVRPVNMQNDLPVDYTEAVVIIGGGPVLMESGIITLEPEQAAIVYLNEAGRITERDVGLVLTLQVQTEKIEVVKAVPVVKA